MLKSFARPENIPANVALIQAIYKVNTKAFSPIGKESQKHAIQGLILNHQQSLFKGNNFNIGTYVGSQIFSRLEPGNRRYQMHFQFLCPLAQTEAVYFKG